MSSTDQAVQLRLPNLLQNWPLKRTLNPHHTPISTASISWFKSFTPIPPLILSSFTPFNLPLFASLVYPNVSAEHLRIGCDMMFAMLLFDEVSDWQGEEDVRRRGGIIKDVLRDPHDLRPEGEDVLGRIFQRLVPNTFSNSISSHSDPSFWSRALSISSPSASRSYINSLETYIDSVVVEASDRSSHRLRTIEEYLSLRRRTIGVKPCFDLLFFDTNIDLDQPEMKDSLKNPMVESLVDIAVDMIILTNDILSYNVEHSRNEDAHNIITVTIRERRCSIQQALDHVGEWYHRLQQQFLVLFNDLSSLSTSIHLEPEIKEFIQGIGNFITGNIAWHFETERYFGKHGLEVQNHKTITLLPRKTTPTPSHL
ncbi:terpenoid synthase [Sistotremastrum suecicum HHB10207 ss-3]|uniref:Terpene synthase n=1 Tax=Sistotremastrum suecicum HHB10207 ss-3 TaxID=1314776 RepID=A0A165Z3R0_9AGAM|nr:terpenoid synthase [Sistotremastrum suecicum HHB10207 ss-3]